MRIAGIHLGVRNAGMLIGALYVYGAVLEIVGIVWSRLSGGNIPNYSWWQFLLAPFVIGATAVALEGLGTFLTNGFAFDQTESKVRVELGKAVLVTLLLLLVIGLPIYHMSQQ